MDRLKVGKAVLVLVYLDDDEACDKGGKTDIIYRSVDVRSRLLLLGGVCGLEDKSALSDEEEAGRVQKL